MTSTIRKSARGGVGSRLVAMAAAVAASAMTFTVAGPAMAQAAPSPAEAAREAARGARAAAHAADQYADKASARGRSRARGKPGASPVQRARQGVVVIERNGKKLGLGTVLAGDGRILTALSVVGHGNSLDARLPDGSVMRVRVGHTDRGWDLALLVPQNARWRKGLRASRVDISKLGSALTSFSLVGGKVAPSRTIVKGQKTLLGGDSTLLKDALEMGSRFSSTDVGSPVINQKGEVVAVVGRACLPLPDGACTRVPFGVPVSAARAFLRTVPKSAVPPAPWLGIRGVAADTGTVRGVRLTGVHPASPAAAAGLQSDKSPDKADVIVAVNNRPVLTPQALSGTINQRAVGDTVELLLFGNGQFRRVTVTLRPAPGTTAAAPGAKKAPRVRIVKKRSVRRATR